MVKGKKSSSRRCSRSPRRARVAKDSLPHLAHDRTRKKTMLKAIVAEAARDARGGHRRRPLMPALVSELLCHWVLGADHRGELLDILVGGVRHDTGKVHVGLPPSPIEVRNC